MMSINKTAIFSLIAVLALMFSCKNDQQQDEPEFSERIYKTTKPLTRWWWFADTINKKDITYQLDMLKNKNFGGVEIAWVYPVSRVRYNNDPEKSNTKRFKFLGDKWQKVVVFTKKYCDSIGLECDFTFGTGWPFGGTFVDYENATKVWNSGDDDYKECNAASWEYPAKGYVIDHLSSEAFSEYADEMGEALKPALKGSKSCLFCDSWEVETHKIWTDGFADAFRRRYSYDITKYMDSIYSEKYSAVHYDYMKLVSDYVINNFYRQFTKWANDHNSFSRSQCSGAPVDVLTAYATQDVPESEAMLYEPAYSMIPHSAAVLSGKKTITSETFTCIYGFPERDSTGTMDDKYLKEERTADLKLVADALFANGVNQIIWHGKPYNPRGTDSTAFYATVHAGKDGKLWDDIGEFNKYMSKVSKYLRTGVTYSDIAVYIPQEDAWRGQKMENPDPQMPWAWGEYEMRYIRLPDELEAYQPLWINHHFLKKAVLKNDKLLVGDAEFSALYIDVNYIDEYALKTIYSIAEKGFPVCLKRTPEQAGYIKSDDFNDILNELTELPNVSTDIGCIKKTEPLIKGKNLPPFICKKNGDKYYLFFAHPKSKDLQLPLEYGQAETDKVYKRNIEINIMGKTKNYDLKFKPHQSVLLEINEDMEIGEIEI